MKYLGNNKYEITNTRTGETKVVDKSQLGQYGLSAPAEQSKSVGNKLLSFLVPRTQRVGQDIATSSQVGGYTQKMQGSTDQLINIAKQMQQARASGDTTKMKQLALQSKAIAGQGDQIQAPQFSSDIGKSYLSRGVGVGGELGSYLSGGLGLSGAKTGAIAGSLLGLTTPGATAGERVIGGVTGGVTGAVTGKILDKLLGVKNVGEKLKQGVTNPKVKISPKMYQQQEELSRKATELGLKGSAKNQLKQVGQKYEVLGTTLREKVAGSNPTVVGKETITAVKGALKGEVDTTSNVVKEQMSKWTQKLKAASGNNEALLNLKFELQGQLAPVYKKLTMGNPLTDQEVVKLTFHNSIDDLLRGSIEEVGPILKQMSALHELAPGLYDATRKGLQIPILGKTTMATQPLQASQSALGGLLSKAPSNPKIASGLSPVLQNILKGERDVAPQTPSPQVQPNQPSQGMESLQVAPKSQKTGMTEQEYITLLLTAPKQADLWKQIYDIGAKKVDTKQAEVEAGGRLVDELGSMYSKVQEEGLTAQSPLLGRLKGAAGTYGAVTQTSTAAATYNSVKKAFLSKLSRATGEKGVLTDKDLSRIEKALPTFYDTPGVAENKLKEVKMIITSAISSATPEQLEYLESLQ